MNKRGWLKSISQDGTKATVVTDENEEIVNVVLKFPYGFYSRPAINQNTQVTLTMMRGSNNVYGEIYNVPLQPSLTSTEVEMKNPIKNNKVTLKDSGEINITNQNQNIEITNQATQVLMSLAGQIDLKSILANNKISIKADGSITIEPAEAKFVNIGSATDFALNLQATFDVFVNGVPDPSIVVVPKTSGQGTDKTKV